MRVAILGCGMAGESVAKRLGSSDAVSRLIMADKDGELALRVANEMGAKAVAQQVDVTEGDRLQTVLAQADLVFNATAPMYKFALGVIQAVCAQKVDYVDVSGGAGVAEELFLKPYYDDQAKQAGITVLFGTGGMPGLSNLLAKYGSQQLEAVKAIHLYVPFNYNYVCEGLRFMTPGTIDDMLHSFSEEVTQYVGGRHTKVKAFTGTQNVTFSDPLGSFEVYYSGWGHSELITLPLFIPGLEEVTFKAGSPQPEVEPFLADLVRYGSSTQDLVTGPAESPTDHLSDYVSRHPASPEGGRYWGTDTVIMQVEVVGESEGRRVRLVYELHDETGNFVDSTAALTVESLLRGEIKAKGVVAPEGCIDPVPFLRKVTQEPGITVYEKREILDPLRF